MTGSWDRARSRAATSLSALRGRGRRATSRSGCHDPVAVIAILEHVGSAEHLHHDLPVLLARRDGATELRMAREQLRSGDDFLCDDCRKLGGLFREWSPEPKANHLLAACRSPSAHSEARAISLLGRRMRSRGSSATGISVRRTERRDLMANIYAKTFDTPDETRPIAAHGKIEIVRLGDVSVPGGS